MAKDPGSIPGCSTDRIPPVVFLPGVSFVYQRFYNRFDMLQGVPEVAGGFLISHGLITPGLQKYQ